MSDPPLTTHPMHFVILKDEEEEDNKDLDQVSLSLSLALKTTGQCSIPFPRKGLDLWIDPEAERRQDQWLWSEAWSYSKRRPSWEEDSR